MSPIAYQHCPPEGEGWEPYITPHGSNKGNTAIVKPLYAIPSGYKLVPIEATEEMSSWIHTNEHYETSERIYKAMIEAAPDIEDIYG